MRLTCTIGLAVQDCDIHHLCSVEYILGTVVPRECQWLLLLMLLADGLLINPDLNCGWNIRLYEQKFVFYEGEEAVTIGLLIPAVKW